MRKRRPHQVLVRLTDEARKALTELSTRWECSEGELIQSVIVQLSHRTDLHSILDVSGQSHLGLLRRCRAALDRAISSAEP